MDWMKLVTYVRRGGKRDEVGVVVHRRFHEEVASDVGEGEGCRVEVMEWVHREENEGDGTGERRELCPDEVGIADDGGRLIAT